MKPIQDASTVPVAAEGTIPALGFSFPLGQQLPETLNFGKAGLLKMFSKQPAELELAERIFGTLNLEKPEHCLYIAYALIMATREWPYQVDNSGPGTPQDVTAYNTLRKSKATWMAIFVFQLLFMTTPEADAHHYPEPILKNMVKTFHPFKIHARMYTHLQLGNRVSIGPPTNVPVSSSHWIPTCPYILAGNYDRIICKWTEKKYIAAFSYCFSQEESRAILSGKGLCAPQVSALIPRNLNPDITLTDISHFMQSAGCVLE